MAVNNSESINFHDFHHHRLLISYIVQIILTIWTPIRPLHWILSFALRTEFVLHGIRDYLLPVDLALELQIIHIRIWAKKPFQQTVLITTYSISSAMSEQLQKKNPLPENMSSPPPTFHLHNSAPLTPPIFLADSSPSSSNTLHLYARHTTPLEPLLDCCVPCYRTPEIPTLFRGQTYELPGDPHDTRLLSITKGGVELSSLGGTPQPPIGFQGNLLCLYGVAQPVTVTAKCESEMKLVEGVVPLSRTLMFRYSPVQLRQFRREFSGIFKRCQEYLTEETKERLLDRFTDVGGRGGRGGGGCSAARRKSPPSRAAATRIRRPQYQIVSRRPTPSRPPDHADR